jgi:hypothetical protein
VLEIRKQQRSFREEVNAFDVVMPARRGGGWRYSTSRPLDGSPHSSTFLGTKMGFDRKLSTAEVTAAVERAFARQEGREPRLPTPADNPVIGELASLDSLEYELQRDTAAAGLGIRVSALDKLVKGRRAATEDENAALPHWNVEPSAEPVDGAALLNNLRQVFRRPPCAELLCDTLTNSFTSAPLRCRCAEVGQARSIQSARRSSFKLRRYPDDRSFALATLAPGVRCPLLSASFSACIVVGCQW